MKSLSETSKLELARLREQVRAEWPHLRKRIVLWPKTKTKEA